MLEVLPLRKMLLFEFDHEHDLLIHENVIINDDHLYKVLHFYFHKNLRLTRMPS